MAILIGGVTVGGCVVPHSPGLRARTGVPNTPPLAGVYATLNDYEADRLVDMIVCRSASQPVDRNAFRSATFVQLPGPTERTRYAKAEIFGFRACDGSDVRFVRGDTYRIVRAPPMYLYERKRTVSVGKATRVVTDFGFSVAAADSVRPLTMDALKHAYPENHRFHDLLDLAFRRNEELIRYDDFHREYTVARLLRETLP
jgi:hypothetical protein